MKKTIICLFTILFSTNILSANFYDSSKMKDLKYSKSEINNAVMKMVVCDIEAEAFTESLKIFNKPHYQTASNVKSIVFKNIMSKQKSAGLHFSSSEEKCLKDIIDFQVNEAHNISKNSKKYSDEDYKKIKEDAYRRCEASF